MGWLSDLLGGNSGGRRVFMPVPPKYPHAGNLGGHDSGIHDRNQEIVSKFNAGMTLERIGRDYGITRERVRQIAAEEGIPPRAETRRSGVIQRREAGEAAKAAKRANFAQRKQAASKLIASGMSKTKASRIVGISVGSLTGIESQHGRWRSDLPAKRHEAVTLYQSGLSISTVASTIGMSAPFVTRALSLARVPTRHRGWTRDANARGGRGEDNQQARAARGDSPSRTAG